MFQNNHNNYLLPLSPVRKNFLQSLLMCCMNSCFPNPFFIWKFTSVTEKKFVFFSLLRLSLWKVDLLSFSKLLLKKSHNRYISSKVLGVQFCFFSYISKNFYHRYNLFLFPVPSKGLYSYKCLQKFGFAYSLWKIHQSFIVTNINSVHYISVFSLVIHRFESTVKLCFSLKLRYIVLQIDSRWLLGIATIEKIEIV